MWRSMFFAMIVIVLVFGCQREPEETNTKGKLHVRVPESIAPVLIEEIKTFMSYYKEHGADVTYSITTSENAVYEFLRDTLRICFTTIPLSDLQFEEAKSISPELSATVFAYDAIVLVVHEKNSTRKITTGEVRKILTGTIKRWQDLSNTQARGTLRVALQDSADIVAYFKAYYGLNTLEINSWIRVQSPDEIIARVKRDENVLGIVPLWWWNSAQNGVVALEVAQDESASEFIPLDPESKGKFYSPHLAYIHLRYYPFYRPLHVYCRSSSGNVAAGFTTFVSHAEGQKIIREQGLLPGTVKIVLK